MTKQTGKVTAGKDKPRKLTKAIVLEGVNYRENIHIDCYDADVTIRPLLDTEVWPIMNKAGKMPEDLDELKALKDTAEGRARLAKMATDDEETFRMMQELCLAGIVADSPEEDLSEVIDKLLGLTTMTIGLKVLEVSHITEGGIEDFFGPPTENLSSPSTSEGTDSEGATLKT